MIAVGAEEMVDSLSLQIALVLLILPYLAVIVIVLTSSRLHTLRVKKDYETYKPTVTVYLPTFNEEKNISKKFFTPLFFAVQRNR